MQPRNRKFCIFCGLLPVDKNKEHVIPRWLIELTGDPNRMARFGFQIGEDESIKFREFRFSKFTFPACTECNSIHSVLETAAGRIVGQILNDEPVSGDNLSTLLDWLDKVRVGLWLGFLPPR